MITFIKRKLNNNKKDDTPPHETPIPRPRPRPRPQPLLNVPDEKERISRSLSLYEAQKQLKKSYSNPNLKDFPDTKPTAKRATNKDKIEFLKEFSSQYGYNGKINAIRSNEYSHMKGAVYLDHSGSTIYAKSVLTSVCNDLSQNLFGNPHSDNPSSSLSSHRVSQTRSRILKHFNASSDDYEVVFTQNATAALRIVGESFPWVAGKSSFKYLRESHNSLLGIRALAEAAGLNDITVVLESEVEDLVNQQHQHTFIEDEEDEEVVYSLFAYPAQCNFSGQRFPLNWTQKLKKNVDTPKSKHLVLLDAAAYAMTAMLSLANKETSPDFVAISFYKIFGFPTGLGCLLVKKELLPILRKKYFGGGTVRAVAYDRPWQRFSPTLSKRFEDGTINFLDIIALNHAFNVHEQLYFKFSSIKPHVTSLIVFLSRRMRSFVHWNGVPACEIYTEREFTDNIRQGPVINFNIRRADGSWVGTAEVERLASANGIHIRVGGHCNPGCISKWVGITVDEVMDTYAKYGMVFGNGVDYINAKPAGGIRLSLGPMSTIDDVLAWLHFFKSYYVEGTVSNDVTKQSVHQQLSPIPNRQSLRNSVSMQQLTQITPKLSKKSSVPLLVYDVSDDSRTSIETPQTLTRKPSQTLTRKPSQTLTRKPSQTLTQPSQTLTRKPSKTSLRINNHPSQRIYRSSELIRRSNVTSAVNRVYL